MLAEGGFPELRIMLCIGGIDMRTQMDILKRGVHMVVATPGRLKDLLHKRRMNLDICRWAAHNMWLGLSGARRRTAAPLWHAACLPCCPTSQHRYLCLDEADRMVDLGFEEEVSRGREGPAWGGMIGAVARQQLTPSAAPPAVGAFHLAHSNTVTLPQAGGLSRHCRLTFPSGQTMRKLDPHPLICPVNHHTPDARPAVVLQVPAPDTHVQRHHAAEDQELC